MLRLLEQTAFLGTGWSPYTKADLFLNAIGDGRYVADHVRCMGYSDHRTRLTSDIDLLRDLDGIVDFDAKIANSAFDLRMAEQELDCTQVPGPPVDQHRLCSTQRVGAELGRIETDAGHPLPDKSGILSGGQSARGIAATGEQELAGLSAGQSQILVDSLSCLIGQLEPDGPASLLLPHRCAIHRITARRHIIDPDSDDVTAAQFAVDGEVE